MITGADGGMGREITLAVAAAGYRVIMASLDPEKARALCKSIISESKNPNVELLRLDLASFSAIKSFAEEVAKLGLPIALLANNAGVLQWKMEYTEEGLEMTTGVNYVGHYLLTALLLPLMERGSRIVNTISCTYRIGKVTGDPFYRKGKGFWRFPCYSDSKLMLTLFTIKLADMLRDAGITVNASDPGIVDTDIIKQGNIVVDKLCDWFFRPIIYTPKRGASTAIHLLLSDDVKGETGGVYSSSKRRKIASHVAKNKMSDYIWDESSKIVGLDMSAICRDTVAKIDHKGD